MHLSQKSVKYHLKYIQLTRKYTAMKFQNFDVESQSFVSKTWTLIFSLLTAHLSFPDKLGRQVTKATKPAYKETAML